MEVAPDSTPMLDKFAAGPWYEDIVKFLSTGWYGDGEYDRHAARKMVSKVKQYELVDGVLVNKQPGPYKSLGYLLGLLMAHVHG